MDLAARTHWIFDMDGTLTVPVHDFAWLHAALGVPEHEDVLATVDARPPDRRAADLALIHRWELEAAARARAQDDASALLHALSAAGRPLGVLTRNTREGAAATLAAAGLSAFFDDDAVLTRECAPPKPHPGGVERLLARWGAPPERAVVVGDWIYDAQAGRAAGTGTVLVLRHGPKPWVNEADLLVDSLFALLPSLTPDRGR